MRPYSGEALESLPTLPKLGHWAKLHVFFPIGSIAPEKKNIPPRISDTCIRHSMQHLQYMRPAFLVGQFESNKALWLHLDALGHFKSPIACVVCGEKFQDRNHLRRHVEVRVCHRVEGGLR